MSTAIIRPQGVVGAVEAMVLREDFTRVLENGDSGVIVDLTDVQVLSAAGLAAVTNIVGRGRRGGVQVRVLPPEEDSHAGLIIEQADLRRFLAPGGLWNTQHHEHVTPPPVCHGQVQALPRRVTHRLRALFLSRS